MPLTERDDDAFGGTVVTLTPPDGLDALPASLRALVTPPLADAYAHPSDRLEAAAKAVDLPGFRAFCARLAALPVAVELAHDSYAHDDEARLVFGETPHPVGASDPDRVEADTGADDLPPPPSPTSPDLFGLEEALPEGTLTPELRAQVEAFGAKMQRALTPLKAVREATADAAALSFVPPDVLDAPPLLRAVYAAVGTIRLGPPGSSAGLVAAQPADYRLDAADPDYLAVFETGTGDVLATTEDGSAAVWLRADNAGETPIAVGTLAAALDAVFASLAEGRVPGPPAEPGE